MYCSQVLPVSTQQRGIYTEVSVQPGKTQNTNLQPQSAPQRPEPA